MFSRRQRAAVGAQVGDQRVGDRLAAADRDRPADGVCERRQHQPSTRGHHRRHLRNRVRCNTAEQSAGVLAGKRAPRGRALFDQPRCQSDRRRQVGRDRALVPEQQLEHAVVVFHQRSEQPPPRRAVVQLGAGAVQVVVADRGGPARQRVAVGDLGDLQRHTAGRQIELGEERRRQRQRVHRRADVVGPRRGIPGPGRCGLRRRASAGPRTPAPPDRPGRR